MSYTAYLRAQPFSLPTGIAALLLGYGYVQVYQGKPAFATREISKAEYNATPLNYLQNPEHHPVAFPKVPGMRSVPDGREELLHKAHHAAEHKSH